MPEFEHWCLPEFSMQKFSLFDDPGGRNFATGLPFTWQLHYLHCNFFDFWKYLKEAQTPPSMVMSKSGTCCTPIPALLQDPWTKKTSLRVCRSRMASSPTQGACLSLQLGYECFGRWVWTCSDPKCGIYCNLDIILMGETMMNKEILGLSNFKTHPDATFPLVSTIPLMR